MTQRKVRSNKGMKRGSYKTSGVITKCVAAFLDKTLKLTKTNTPYLNTKTGNRYSCKSQLEKKKMSISNYKISTSRVGQKPSERPSQFKKGTIRNGYVVKMVRVPASSGYRKAWRKI